MKELWSSIEGWLRDHAPKVLKSLGRGASDKRLATTEAKLQVSLPDEVKESLRIHDGQREIAGGMIEGWWLLSSTNIAGQWSLMKELADKGTFNGAKGEPDGPVRDDWFNLKWIPVAHDGSGNLVCVDLDPPPNGKAGKLVVYWHDRPRRSLIAPDFRTWLSTFDKELHQGLYPTEDGRLRRR